MVRTFEGLVMNRGVNSYESYCRPVVQWMQQGMLDPTDRAMKETWSGQPGSKTCSGLDGWPSAARTMGTGLSAGRGSSKPWMDYVQETVPTGSSLTRPSPTWWKSRRE